jgi:hypothetical protein
MADEMLHASSMAQAWYAEGEAEGRTEEARRLAQMVLERRFGELGQDLLEALSQAQEALLEELILESGLSLGQVHARLESR